MSGELEVISDGDGVVVLGRSSEVARLVDGLTAPVKDLDLPKLRSVVSSGGAAAQASATIAADAGKWIKLTDESGRKLSARQLGAGALGRARSVKDRASTEASERAQRWRKRGKTDA